jgi:RNA polymerase sigma-70 factor (ECF subfamily)
MNATLTMTGSNAQPQLAERSDEELLLDFRKSGNRLAFDQLVHRYERELFSYLRRYLGDAEMAEDAFQATFLQMYLKAGQFEEGRKFRPWLYAVATNQAIDAQRKDKRHRAISLDRQGKGEEGDVGKLADLLVSETPDPQANVNEFERRDWIRQAVAELPELLRVVINVVYYQGLKYREAAEVLNLPIGTIKSRVHTAIAKLNETWKRTHTESN